MPVGFARSLFSGSSRVPKETVVRINGVTAQQTGIYGSRGFSLEKDEMGIGLGALMSGDYQVGYKIAEGTYNMQITGNSSATISVQGINSPGWGVQAKIGKASYNPSNPAVGQTFNVSKTYSGSWASGNSVGVIPLVDVNLPYNFGTVTFSTNEILQVESGSNNSGNGQVQNTPSWTITLYEIIS
jgi:hypothetical protein